MANLHRFSVQEAVNTDTSGFWDVETGVTTTDTTTTHINVTNYHTVLVYASSTIDVLFDNVGNTNCNDTNDIKIPSGLTSLKVPRGIVPNDKGSMYMHWRRNGSTDATVQIVLS